jgi:hypothetical protein
MPGGNGVRPHHDCPNTEAISRLELRDLVRERDTAAMLAAIREMREHFDAVLAEFRAENQRLVATAIQIVEATRARTNKRKA